MVSKQIVPLVLACILTLFASVFSVPGNSYAEGTNLRTVQIIDSIWGNSSDMPPELAHTMYDFIVATAQVIHGEDMDFINYAGTNFVLQADGKPEVYAQITGGFSTNTISGFGFEIANIDSMEVGTAYRLIAPSASTVYRWEVASDVTLIRVSGSKPPVTSGAVPWIESGVTHVPEGPKSFKTYVDRSKLPESMKRFTRIRVMSSDRDLNIRSSGTIHQFTNFSEVYNDQTGYGSSIPRSGQTYALTILYDNEFKPLGFREDVFQVGENGGTVPQQPPANPQPPRNPLDYGSDIDPNLLNKPAQQLFSDVDASYWALSSINDLSSRGVLGGYPDGKFRPERTVTRAELAKIMVLAAGLTVEPVTQTSFADVKPGDWHAPFVEAAKFYLNGYALPDGRLIYDPDAPALREDLAVAIVKLKGYDATHFPDHSILDAMFTDVSSISSYARNYVSIAVESKLVSGFPDDTFRAQLPVTRAQAAAMLHRAYQFGSDTKTEQQANRVKVEFPLPAGVPGTLPTQPPIAIPVPVPPPTTVTETVYGQL